MGEAMLEVKDLRVDFDTKNGRVTAVSGVSFSLEKNKTLGIVGESGCGKSVSMLSILKLLPARTSHIGAETSIKLNGQEISQWSNRAMCKIRGRDISMIFQDPMTSLNPVMTIGRQVSETFRVHQNIGKEAAWRASVEMLRSVGISEPEKRMRSYPHQLSGGMRQRVMIAMALACRPAVLIADEPTTALDVTIQAQILELMRELKRQISTSIILITHDLGVVAEMAEDILVMYAGEVVEQGSAADIFNNPLHPYTRGLMESIPRLEVDRERLNTIRGAVPDLSQMPKGCRFCERCAHATPRCSAQRPELTGRDGHLVRCFMCQGGL